MKEEEESKTIEIKSEATNEEAKWPSVNLSDKEESNNQELKINKKKEEKNNSAELDQHKSDDFEMPDF